MEGITTVLFDFGGTLDYPGRHASRVLRESLGYAGISLQEQIWREAYVYAERKLEKETIVCPYDDYFITLYKKLCVEIRYLVEAHVEGISDVTISARKAAAFCYDGAEKNIRHTESLLRDLGKKYKIGLVTNFYGNIRSVLRGFGMDGMFRIVTESAAVGVRKPDPEIFRLALEASGSRADETIVVGDSVKNDIMPSLSIGCRAIRIKGEGWTDREEPRSPGVKEILSPDELRGILL